jgi:anti-sigma regulatory factor (Ser/Thr protein kinase)
VSADQTRQFTARLAQLAAVNFFIEDYCMLRGLPREAALRLNLVVEELFTNSALHGYGGECDEPIWVGLAGAGQAMEICYEDAAPAYNPLERLQDGYVSSVTATITGRPIGGLGVFLVAQLAHTTRYARVEGRNRLTITMRSVPY